MKHPILSEHIILLKANLKTKYLAGTPETVTLELLELFVTCSPLSPFLSLCVRHSSSHNGDDSKDWVTPGALWSESGVDWIRNKFVLHHCLQYFIHNLREVLSCDRCHTLYMNELFSSLRYLI